MDSKQTYSCIILDDDELDILTVATFIKKYSHLNIKAKFNNSIDAITYLDNNEVDIIFLDIELSETNGIEFLRKIQNFKGVCVYVTAHAEFALDSFDVAAFDYILKPIQAERFENCIKRLYDYLQIKDKARQLDCEIASGTIFIRDGSDNIKIKLSEVLFLEALKDYTQLITENKKHIVLSNIGLLLQDENFKSFIRIHRSFAVQKKYIERYNHRNVFVKNFALPIGRSYKSNFENIYK